MMSTAGIKSKVEISKRLVLINSASSMMAMALNVSVLVWLQQYLLHRVTPEEYSLLPALYSVMMFAPLLTTVLTSGMGRYTVEACAKGDQDRVTQIVSTMFPLLLAAGLAFLALGWLFAWNVHHVLTIAPDRVWDTRIMMALMMFSAAVRLPLAPFGTGLYVRQKFVLQNTIDVTMTVLRIITLFVLLFGVSTRVLWVVVASVSAELSGVLITTSISRRLVPALHFRAGQIRWRIARELTSFGGWITVGTVADTIRTSADVIILNKFGTPMEVTCFYLGSLPQGKISQTVLKALGPLGPALTAMYATKDEKRLSSTYLRVGRYGLWVSLFVALPLMIYRTELTELYVGKTYLPAATVMLLLLMMYPIHYGNLLAASIGQATGEVRRWNLIAIAAHSINLLLTLYFVCIRQMGAVGCALATFLVSVVASPLFFWPLGLRLARVRCGTWLRETMWPGFLPGLVGASVWICLRISVHPQSWRALGLCTTVGSALYVIVLITMCLRANDRGIIIGLLEGIKGRLRFGTWYGVSDEA